MRPFHTVPKDLIHIFCERGQRVCQLLHVSVTLRSSVHQKPAESQAVRKADFILTMMHFFLSHHSAEY